MPGAEAVLQGLGAAAGAATVSSGTTATAATTTAATTLAASANNVIMQSVNVVANIGLGTCTNDTANGPNSWNFLSSAGIPWYVLVFGIAAGVYGLVHAIHFWWSRSRRHIITMGVPISFNFAGLVVITCLAWIFNMYGAGSWDDGNGTCLYTEWLPMLTNTVPVFFFALAMFWRLGISSGRPWEQGESLPRDPKDKNGGAFRTERTDPEFQYSPSDAYDDLNQTGHRLAAPIMALAWTLCYFLFSTALFSDVAYSRFWFLFWSTMYLGCITVVSVIYVITSLRSKREDDTFTPARAVSTWARTFEPWFVGITVVLTACIFITQCMMLWASYTHGVTLSNRAVAFYLLWTIKVGLVIVIDMILLEICHSDRESKTEFTARAKQYGATPAVRGAQAAAANRSAFVATQSAAYQRVNAGVKVT